MTATDAGATTPIDLDELERLATAATGTEWAWNSFRVPELEATVGDPETYTYRSTVLEATHGGECGCRSACELELSIEPQDAAFIAGTGPDVVLALVQRIRDLEAANQRGALPFAVVNSGGDIIARLAHVPDIEGAFFGWTGVQVVDERPRDERWLQRHTPWGADPATDTFTPPSAR